MQVTISMLSFRHLLFVLVCALSCRADTWPEGDDQLDTDLDLLLDVLRRTRGTSVPPPKKKLDYTFGGNEVISLIRQAFAGS
jgi:hypothetical protein